MESLKTEKIRIAKQADVFITKTATKTLTSTSVVEKVMNFYFRDLIKALSNHTSVEVSGFGRFQISPNKLKRKLRDLGILRDNMQNQLEKGTSRLGEEETKLRIVGLDKEINYLKTRDVDETKFEGYCLRMEKSLLSTGEDQKINTGD